MKSIISLILVLFALGMTGCASLPPPSAQELAVADYGPEITPEYAEKKIVQYFGRILIDPYSAIYRNSTQVQKHWMRDRSGKFHYGYATGFAVNAKNRMGGYTGEKLYFIVFYKGEVFRVSEVRYGGRDIYPDPYVFEQNL